MAPKAIAFRYCVSAVVPSAKFPYKNEIFLIGVPLTSGKLLCPFQVFKNEIQGVFKTSEPSTGCRLDYGMETCYKEQWG